MNRRDVLAAAVGCVIGRTGVLGAQAGNSDARRQAEDAERGFAATMARRDFQAFQAFLADEAIFIGGGEKPTASRGKKAIADRWRRFFEGPDAPFSWSPDLVEVLDSGTLALTSGIVRNPEGKPIGMFNSIWRRETDQRWRVVFDRGCAICSAG